MTRRERMQIREALAYQPPRPELEKLASPRERGCSVAEGEYERHLVARAIAEARRNRAKSVNH